MKGLLGVCVHLFLTLLGYHKWGQWEDFPLLECDVSILMKTGSEAQRKRIRRGPGPQGEGTVY